MSLLRGKRYDEALTAFEEAAGLYAVLHDEVSRARMLQFIADLHLGAGRGDSALEVYATLVDLLKRAGDSRREAHIHNNTGLLLSRKSEYREAIRSFRRALSLFESLGERDQVAAQWGNIGSVHRDLEEYDEALESYGKALPLYRALRHSEGIGDQLTNIAYIHVQRGEDEKALALYRQALPLYEEAGAHKKREFTRRNVENLSSKERGT
jgi:tetratricopeptide (TPR) repeat protein